MEEAAEERSIRGQGAGHVAADLPGLAGADEIGDRDRNGIGAGAVDVDHCGRRSPLRMQHARRGQQRGGAGEAGADQAAAVEGR